MKDFDEKKSKNKLNIYDYAKDYNIDIDEIQCNLSLL